MRAVKVSQAMLVRREVRRHPIENHGDAPLMQVVHQEHEILRCSVTRGGSKVASSLISPGAVKRMLHHRQQFNVRELHALNVFGKTRRHLTIAEGSILLAAHPGSEMDLVDGNRGMQRILFHPLLQPLAITPLIVEVPDHRSRTRRFFMQQPKRIRLVDDISVMMRNNVEFVNRTLTYSGDKAFPYSRRTPHA